MTRQVPDRLEADGVGYFLTSCPPILPAGHPLWRRCRFLRGSSTAHVRGYVARWLIRDGRLFLAGFGGNVAVSDGEAAWSRSRLGEEEPSRPIGMAEVYECTGPVPATWLSGDLRSHSVRCSTPRPHGETIPESFRLFRIVNGRVTADMRLSNREERVEIRQDEARALLDGQRAGEETRLSRDGHRTSPVPGLFEMLAGGASGTAPADLAGLLWWAGPTDLEALAAGFEQSRDHDRRRWIAYAAGRIGTEAAPLADKLALALAATTDLDGVEALAYALAGIGAPAAFHLPAVIVRVEALCGLGHHSQVALMIERISAAGSEAIQPLLAALATARDANTHAMLAHALGRIGPTAIGPLVAAFRGAAQARQRATLARALGSIGPSAAPALGDLVEAVGAAADDPSRAAMAEALTAIGLRSPASLGPLRDALRASRDLWTLRRIVEAMASLGPVALPILLAEFEANQDPAARTALAEGLGGFGPEAGAAVASLGAAVGATEDAALGTALAEALRMIGTPAALLATAQIDAATLAPRASGTEAILRKIARGVIPSPAAIQGLAGLLAIYGESALGRHTAQLLGAMGAAAIGPLSAALESAPNEPVRLLVLHALGLIGPAAVDAREALIGSLVEALAGAAEDRVRLQIVDDLRRIGPAPAAHLKTLVTVMRRSGFAPVQWRLGLVIAEIGAPAVAPLVALLEETSDEDRRRALGNALGRMGETAIDAAPALMAAMRTARDPRTREILASALRRTAMRLA